MDITTRIGSTRKRVVARLSTGSQASYISAALADQLGVASDRHPNPGEVRGLLGGAAPQSYVSSLRIARDPVPVEVGGVKHDVAMLVLPNPPCGLLLGQDYIVTAGTVEDCSDPGDMKIGVREGARHDNGQYVQMVDTHRPGEPTFFEDQYGYSPQMNGFVEAIGTIRVELGELPPGENPLHVSLQAPGDTAWSGRFVPMGVLFASAVFADSTDSFMEAVAAGTVKMGVSIWKSLHLRTLNNPVDSRPISSWVPMTMDLDAEPNSPGITTSRSLAESLQRRLERVRCTISLRYIFPVHRNFVFGTLSC